MLKGRNALLYEPLFATSVVGAELCAKPLGFVDVGARGGVHPVVEPLAGVTAVLAFDANEAECARMESEVAEISPFANLRIIPAALAGQKGPANLYRFAMPTNDSLLPENPLAVRRYNIKSCERVGTTPLITTTLDSILFDKEDMLDSFGEFIKIDVQGADFDVLRGAQQTLTKRTVALVIETYFFPLYEGQKLFSDIESFLRERGFFFYGFNDIHSRSCRSLNKFKEAGRERIYWADAVFFKDPLAVDSHSQCLTERANQVLFVCALLTGYYDFALELAIKTWALGEEAKHVEMLIHRVADLSPDDTYHKLMGLIERVQENPERANFEVGRFVDERRLLNDYDDLPPFRQL